MIAWLEGRLADCWQEGGRHGLLLICAGVGYELQVCAQLHSHCSQLVGDQCLSLAVHQLQREGGSSLYGFSSQTDRNLFRLLIGVNGVGPQAALALLSAHGADGLVVALDEEDLQSLCLAHGVGKRIAERLLVEWRSKLQSRWCGTRSITPLATNEMGKTVGGKQQWQQELVMTLTTLGYGPVEIRQALAAAQGPDAGVDHSAGLDPVLRFCLAWLSGAN
jgi:Holliday junction DNA helicase RuvA